MKNAMMNLRGGLILRPKGSAAVLEARRHRALRLLDQGRSLNEVSRLLDCAPSSVMRWRDAREAGGEEALRVRFSPGRPPKLGARERRRWVQLLLGGAQAHGYTTDRWTTAPVARVILRGFRVRHHRALERNEKRIEHWKRETWPRIKKATRLGAHLVFAGESGFLWIPNVRRTWAPRGQTPLLRHHQRRERISVVSGLSVSPRRRRCGLYFLLSPKNIQHPEMCAFLRDLLCHLRGPVIVIWDNGTIHGGEADRRGRAASACCAPSLSRDGAVRRNIRSARRGRATARRVPAAATARRGPAGPASPVRWEEFQRRMPPRRSVEPWRAHSIGGAGGVGSLDLARIGLGI